MSKAMTDIGNGQRFAEGNSDFVRYVPEWKKWVVWVVSRSRLKKLVASLPMGALPKSASQEARTATISRSLDT